MMEIKNQYESVQTQETSQIMQVRKVENQQALVGTYLMATPHRARHGGGYIQGAHASPPTPL